MQKGRIGGSRRHAHHAAAAAANIMRSISRRSCVGIFFCFSLCQAILSSVVQQAGTPSRVCLARFLNTCVSEVLNVLHVNV
jgi:hypothetical protein